MKAPIRLFILTALLVLALAVPLTAQEEESGDTVTFGATEGVISINIAEGTTLEAAEDGYLLTVSSGLEFAPLFAVIEDDVRAYQYPLLELQGDWDFAEELSAAATLSLNSGENFSMEVTAPTFNAEEGTLTFAVPEIEDIEIDKAGEPVLPEIDGGSLMIRLNSDVLSGLATGREARLANTRGGIGIDPDWP